MILQRLVDYYERSDEVAPPGWERKRIPFFIEVASDGTFLQLTSMKFGPKATDVPAQLVPCSEIRSGTKSFEKPNLLWDHIGFVIGHPKSDEPKDVANAKKQLEHFRRRVSDFARQATDSIAVQAVERFYEQREYLRVHGDPLWTECIAIPGCNVTFRLAGDTAIVVQDPTIQNLVAKDEGVDTGEVKGVCLVTGDLGVIANLHPKIANVADKPTALAAVNDQSLPALASYGKHQGQNFPVGKSAAFKYATALNHLLRPHSPQRIAVGDASTVFWAQKPDALEHELAALLGGGDNPDAHTQQVKALFDSVHSGSFTGARGDNAFYVLGLAPNAARISVRFWHAAPLHVIAERIATWFDDLSLVRGPNDPEFPSLFRLLTAVALQGKADNIPPSLGGDLIRSIFTGATYPTTWLNAAVQRCRAEQQVTYMRAAAIKAYLNRFLTTSDSQPREIQPMLDIESLSTAYRLGRLFATLEKIQEEASPGLNATIRERYYGAASSTPVAVFTTLMRLKNHHLAKIQSKGRAVHFEKLLAEIMSGISDFPVHMNLPDQGRFAIGYYHQRQDFFTKRESAEAESTALTETAH